MDTTMLPLAFFAFLSYTLSTFSGFGAVIITITLGAYLYPVEWMLPVLMPVTLLSNLYILIRHRQHVDRQVLFKHVLPAMGIGLLIGIGIFNYIQGDTLKRLLGVMIVVLSARELINMFAKRKNSAPLSRSKSTAYVLSAGIVHGIYATGGPLLVYALNRLNMSKSIFRSTLAAIWTALNIVLVFSYVLTEKVTAMTLQTSTIILPSLVFGLLIGDMLHHRINERLFRIFTFALLLISGLPIIFK